MRPDPRPDMIVVRCSVCAEVFPTEDRAAPSCPSCGSSEVERAAEYNET